MMHMKIEEMPAGRALDAVVAVKVMGDDIGVKPEHTWFNTGGDCDLEWRCQRCNLESNAAREGPCDVRSREYSIEIADAWKVVEKLRIGVMPFTHVREDESERWVWGATWREKAGGILYVNDLDPDTLETYGDFVFADTAPLAICRAALLAVQDKSSPA